MGSAVIAAAALLAACGSSPSTPLTAGTTTTASGSATTGTSGSTGSSAGASTSYLTQSLTGSKRTTSFTAPACWRLTFNYNCSALGHKGAFTLDLHRSGGSSVKVTSQEGLGGGGTHLYPAGTFTLSARTPCNWTVHATSP